MTMKSDRFAAKRVVPLLLALTLVLAGCGGAPPKPSEPAKTSQEPAQSAAPAKPEAPKERVVKHAMGETKVPAEPKRVVVIDQGELDMVLALGVKPVGAGLYNPEGPWPTYLKNTEGITRIGSAVTPNLEAIAALQPDLILSNKNRHEKIYDKLSQIAPTVLADGLGYGWKEAFKTHAEALGKTAEHDKVMAAYDKKAADIKAKFGSTPPKISVIRSFPDHIRIMMKQSFIGRIITDAGLPRSAAQDKDIFMERGTVERIPDMDGDVIFLLYYNKDKGEQISKLKENPLWNDLKAVKSNKVFTGNDETWGTGLGPTAAMIVIEDIYNLLTK